MANEQDKQDIRDQANRIFQHGLYEDSALTERSNYFLDFINVYFDFQHTFCVSIAFGSCVARNTFP